MHFYGSCKHFYENKYCSKTVTENDCKAFDEAINVEPTVCEF